MSAALVSVIMPCYNDGRYIKDAVDSLKRQTYSHYELIVVDDGSDDSETLSILSTLNGGKTTILHTNHLGPAGARNYGIELAKGTIDKLYEDSFNIYKAFTTAEEKLYLLYSSSDMQGKALRPSMLINKIKKIYPMLQEQSDVIER